MENVLFVEDLIHELQKVLDEYGNVPVFIRMGTDTDSGHGAASSVKMIQNRIVEIIPV